MKRRDLLKTTALATVGPAALALGAHAAEVSEQKEKTPPDLRNEDFYTDGKFDVEKAKDGVIALCKHYGYPVFPGMREGLWVSDYGTGQFLKLGLAAYMFENHHDEGGCYMMLDLFLMPGQMLPEHWHTKGDHGITKNEGWLVRWGTSYIVGIGEDNLAEFPQVKIPKRHCGGTATTGHCVAATPGMFVPLAKTESRHWQFGGPQGAIITEVANFHTSSTTFHSDQEINKNFLES